MARWRQSEIGAAPTKREWRRYSGASIEATKLVATITPTPGQVINRRQVGSLLAGPISRQSSTAICALTAFQAARSGSMVAESEGHEAKGLHCRHRPTPEW